MKAICSSRSVAFPTVNPLAPRLNHYAYINENSKSLLRCIVGFKNKSKPRRPRLTAALEGSESNIGDDHGIGEKNGVSSSSEGSDDQGKIQSVTWRQFLEEAARLVRTNIWVLLLIHFTCDSLVFVLHRLSHRLTNERKLLVL